MDWTLTFKSNICQDAALLDKKTRKLFAQAQERLTTVPNVDDGKLIKKLQGYKNFWRLKMNNYRLIYEVDDNDRTGRCLMMGGKNSVYKRFGVDENGPSLPVGWQLYRPQEPQVFRLLHVLDNPILCQNLLILF